MVLDIIIPQYKETIEDMDALLSNLNHQIGINFNDMLVTIVNDCGTPLNAVDLLKYSNLRFQLLSTEKNSGCGVTRQVGIDNTKGELIIFIDADDSLVSYTTISELIKKINESQDKGIWVAKTYEELSGGGYVELDTGNTWMHGKVYRRQYIEKLGLRFADDLRIHEDSYFNALAMWGMDKYVKKINVPMYIWRTNPTSTVRTDSMRYVFEGNHTWMIQATRVAYLLIKANRDAMIEYILNILFNCYYTRMLDALYTDKYSKYQDEIDKDFYEFYKKYGRVSEEIKLKIRNTLQKNKEKGMERLGKFTKRWTYDEYVEFVKNKFKGA